METDPQTISAYLVYLSQHTPVEEQGQHSDLALVRGGDGGELVSPPGQEQAGGSATPWLWAPSAELLGRDLLSRAGVKGRSTRVSLVTQHCLPSVAVGQPGTHRGRDAHPAPEGPREPGTGLCSPAACSFVAVFLLTLLFCELVG